MYNEQLLVVLFVYLRLFLHMILSVAGKDPDTRMDEGTDLSLALILTENLENSNFSVHRT